MSRLRRPFLWDRSISVTADWLSEYTGVDAAEQESQCGLTIDRVPYPADENARKGRHHQERSQRSPGTVRDLLGRISPPRLGASRAGHMAERSSALPAKSSKLRDAWFILLLSDGG